MNPTKWLSDLLRKPIFWIFIFGLFIRFFSIYPYNTIVGFDQARDLFASKTILTQGDIKIIGPTAGNNPDLHHGVLYLYYILPGIVLSGGNPAGVAIWNSLFNAFGSVIIYYLAFALFKNKKTALISSFICAISFEFVQYSGWLSNPSPTIWSVPLFFYGLWSFMKAKNIKAKKWGLPLASFALGLSIQFELFFLYLIPISLLLMLYMRPKLPNLKIVFLSMFLLVGTLSTMILTEIKFGFAGVKSLIGAGEYIGGGLTFSEKLNHFISRFHNEFSKTFLPSSPILGSIIALVVVVFLLYKIKTQKQGNAYLFLLVYLFSPAIMLILGYHASPWFLVGLPPAIALGIGLLLTQIKTQAILVGILTLLAILNLGAIKSSYGHGQTLLEPDESAILASQIKVIDYTYVESKNESFTINTVTNPLYINAVWGYHYDWYGNSKYGYLPTFSGGDQLYPYNTLEKQNNTEKYLYVIIDQTFRIPQVHKLEAIKWADAQSKLVEETQIPGILIQKRILP